MGLSFCKKPGWKCPLFNKPSHPPPTKVLSPYPYKSYTPYKSHSTIIYIGVKQFISSYIFLSCMIFWRQSIVSEMHIFLFKIILTNTFFKPMQLVSVFNACLVNRIKSIRLGTCVCSNYISLPKFFPPKILRKRNPIMP